MTLIGNCVIMLGFVLALPGLGIIILGAWLRDLGRF